MSMFTHAGNVVSASDKQYYFLPFWIEKIDSVYEDGSLVHIVETHRLGELPEELIEQIEEMRKLK